MAGADIIAAPATPAGESAVAMLRLSGPACRELAGRFIAFPPKLPARAPTLAQASDEAGPVDRVLVTFFPGPGSYTGEDLVEICAHGSPYILSRLLARAQRLGARLAEPGEFTMRAFLNGRLDLAQAEAVGALIRARASLAHRAALEQLEGGLSRRVEAFRGEILDLLAWTEALIDHPEEDIPGLSRKAARGRIAAARDGISSFAATYKTGRLAADGARVAIVGPPNAGKSSLLNALLGRDRAIVSAEPGTTRDTLEEEAEIGGFRTLLIDTAGLRDAAPDPVEREGMERARRALRAADLSLLVLDRSLPLGPEEKRLLHGARAIVVLNKTDLTPHAVSAEDLGGAPCIAVSAALGTGLGELKAALKERLAGAASPTDGGCIVASLRHFEALSQAAEALGRAEGVLGEWELAALHLREALSALGDIVGQTAPEDVLKSVFSKFCVGK